MRAAGRDTALLAMTEAALLGATCLDAGLALPTTPQSDAWAGWPAWFAVLALLGVVLRHRFPTLGFAATLPALATSNLLIASTIALYTVARRRTDRRVVVIAALATAVGYVVKIPLDLPDEGFRQTLLTIVDAALVGAGPAALGQLAAARIVLRGRLRDLATSNRAEQAMRDEQVREQERVHLAREMHDVVSHQVSLIAVQAGALRVGTRDDAVRQVAETIRLLATATLDELRHMVAVLRSTGPTPLQPQPTLADLPVLVQGDGPGVGLQLDLEPGTELDPHVQRAIYRTVQEALTNARKHAPGAPVRVSVEQRADQIVTTVTNGPGAAAPSGLPSAQHGLIGLRERAEALNGTVTAGPDDAGGFRVAMSLPPRLRP